MPMMTTTSMISVSVKPRWDLARRDLFLRNGGWFDLDFPPVASFILMFWLGGQHRQQHADENGADVNPAIRNSSSGFPAATRRS